MTMPSVDGTMCRVAASTWTIAAGWEPVDLAATRGRASSTTNLGGVAGWQEATKYTRPEVTSTPSPSRRKAQRSAFPGAPVGQMREMTMPSEDGTMCRVAASTWTTAAGWDPVDLAATRGRTSSTTNLGGAVGWQEATKHTRPAIISTPSSSTGLPLGDERG